MTINRLLTECVLPTTVYLATRFAAKSYQPLTGAALCTFALYRGLYHLYPKTKSWNIKLWNAKILQNSTYRKGIAWGFVVTCLGALYLAPKSPYLGYAAGSILGILAAIKYPDTQVKKAT